MSTEKVNAIAAALNGTYRHSPPPNSAGLKMDPPLECDDQPLIGMPAVGDINSPAVGDINSPAVGTGARFNAGKPALDMIPLHLLEGAARVFQKATQKPVNPYPKWNWAKGMPWSVPTGCLKRHLAAFERGENLDTDTAELHIDHMICNLLMLKHYQTAFVQGDDRCEYFRAERA